MSAGSRVKFNSTYRLEMKKLFSNGLKFNKWPYKSMKSLE